MAAVWRCRKTGACHFTAAKGIRIADCTIIGAGGNGIALERCDGSVTANTISGADNNALFCVDNTGLSLARTRFAIPAMAAFAFGKAPSATTAASSRTTQLKTPRARSGGTGENGNAINVFRAAGVIVRNNMISRAAFSAIRGNASSNIQIIGNNCAELRETAIYAEFDFEGAIVAYNVIDDSRKRNLRHEFRRWRRACDRCTAISCAMSACGGWTIRREGAGIGIGVEAETAATGNVIENAPYAGMRLGFGPYLRNVTANANAFAHARSALPSRLCRAPAAAAITDNIIEGAKRGAIVGMEWHKPVTGDLARRAPTAIRNSAEWKPGQISP